MNRKEAIEAVKNNLPHSSFTALREALETLIPELKESEDERISKRIYNYINVTLDDNESAEKKKWLAWLEKQGEKKSIISDDALREGIAHFGITQYQIDNWLKKYVDVEKQGSQNLANSAKICKDEPRFKIGDWVVVNNKHQSIYQVEKIEGGYYTLRHTYGGTFRVCLLHDESLRYWAIQDAKDGDVLCAKGNYFKEYIFNFSSLTEDDVISTHFGYDVFRGTFDTKVSRFGREEEFVSVTPATKEQRDTLFAKMKEAGYEWDAEKKELKKIAQEPAWNDADEERFVSCLQRLGTGNIEQPDTINTMWLKSIKNRVQSIAKFVGEEQYMKGVRDGVNDVIKSPEDYGLLPSPF